MTLHKHLLAFSDRVNRGVEWVLLVIGVAFSLILFAQVLARYMGHSLSWSEEVGRYLLVATSFLGATVAYKRAEFIGLTGFGARFGHVVERVIVRALQLLTLACFGLITWFGVATRSRPGTRPRRRCRCRCRCRSRCCLLRLRSSCCTFSLT